MAERSSYEVLFVRRKPRMFGATYGPIRSDPGTFTIHQDYLEFEGSGVRYQGWKAMRVIVPCVIFLAGPVGAVIAYFLVEYALTKPTRLTIPLIRVHRVLLDPLQGTVMVGVTGRRGGATTWHSFATAYAWAIFDQLEEMLEPGACGLITRRERALARGDLGLFLAVCSLTPAIGILASVAGIWAGVAAAALGERRHGLTAVALCLVTLAAQAILIYWWVTY